MDADVLYANMEHLATLDPPVIHPTLPPLPGGFGPLPDDFHPSAPSILLQVNAVEDVSLPRAHRLRAMAPRGEPLAEAAGELPQPAEDEAVPRRGRRQRYLRLTLTDGFTRIAAVEDSRGGCDALRSGVAWGAKLRVAAPFVARHGVLVLTSRGTELLGGAVAELQVFWERHAVDALARLSGRPQRRVEPGIEGTSEVEGWERAQGNSAGQQSGHPQQYQQTGSAQQHQQQSGLPQHQQQTGTAQQYQQQSGLPQQYQQTGSAQQHQQSGHPHLHRSVPVLPVVKSPPASPQPLAAWTSHHPFTAPFTTIAVIAEVTSELTIREVGEQFSLLVLLVSPGGAEGEEDGLVVDLGHEWLQRTVGMFPAAFRALSTSRRPEDVARLGEIVEGIGRALENFGEAVFVLRLREVDGVVEVIETRQQHQ